MISSWLQLIALAVCSATAQLVQSNTSSTTKGAVIDLGYARYQGYQDPSSGQEFFLGIRYAAPPQRWQAPIKPLVNRTQIIQANVYGSRCYQTVNSGPLPAYNDPISNQESDNCLFLNVWRPSNVTSATSFPVLFWIHGGGYGSGDGRNDPTFLSQITETEFIFVSIQYRLGAFGFLSSAEVAEKGVVNAGLLDQKRALEWVQQHIGSFGGDADRVTIFGESAGAGSVMLQILAYGGTMGTSLFQQSIAASPYMPKQYGYSDSVPTKYYELLAQTVGCTYPTGSYPGLFSCLNATDSITLSKASNTVSKLAFPGDWAFVPVTDGIFVQESPPLQLLKGKVNGQRLLVGNNFNEGKIFVPYTNITSLSDVKAYIQSFLPQLSSTSLSQLYNYYPEPQFSGGLYATQSERVALLYGDAVFNCPGNWLADAFPQAYRYQYARPEALHGLDVPNYLPNPAAGQVFPSVDNPFSKIFDTALVKFAVSGVPSLASSNLTFPLWGNASAYGYQANFNISGGLSVPLTLFSVFNFTLSIGGTPNITVNNGLRLTNGANRCDFWRANAAIVS